MKVNREFGGTWRFWFAVDASGRAPTHEAVILPSMIQTDYITTSASENLFLRGQYSIRGTFAEGSASSYRTSAKMKKQMAVL